MLRQGGGAGLGSEPVRSAGLQGWGDRGEDRLSSVGAQKRGGDCSWVPAAGQRRGKGWLSDLFSLGTVLLGAGQRDPWS